MEQTYRPGFADILEVHEDRNGPYAKVKVYCTDGSITIRWGLDTFTFRHLALALQAHNIAADAMSRTSRLMLDAVKPQSNGSLQCSVIYVASGQAKGLPFQCSELFQSNHTWLSQVGSFRQLQHLTWVDIQPTKPDRPVVSQRWIPRLRQMGISLASFAMLGVVGCGGYWYTVRQHSSVLAGQVKPAMVSVPAPANTLSHPVVYTSPANTSEKASEDPSAATSGSGPINESSSLVDGGGTVTTQNAVLTGGDTSAMVPTATGLGVPEVYKVAPGEVALTFDDGPSPYTEQILKVLNQYHVHGSFFFIGNRVARWPDAVRDVLNSGDLVGNHSENHADFIKLSEIQQAQEVSDCTQAIEQADLASVSLFRPPYGAYNKETLAVLKQDHIGLALWNRDPRDWAAHSPEDIVKSVLSDEPSGGVFDLHDTKMTLEALPAIIEGLQKQNLKFVLLPTH